MGCRIRRNHSGERVDGGAQHTNPGSDQNNGDTGNRIISGGEYYLYGRTFSKQENNYTLYIEPGENVVFYIRGNVSVENNFEINLGGSPEQFVMITTHPHERLRGVFRQARKYARHTHVEIENILTIHVARRNREVEYHNLFNKR